VTSEKENQPQPKKSRNTITFNCLIKGSPLTHAFPIYVSVCKMTNNLSNLKDIIKVQLPPEYSDVHVHHFKLWKVNIRDDQEDELSNITLRDSDILLATRKIRYYFLDDPGEDYIHIIVEAKNSLKLEVMELKDHVKALQNQITSEKSSLSNDVQHQTNPIIARNKNINQILNIPSPSIAAQHSIFFYQSPPVILFNNIFNKFIIDLENENLPISPKVSSMLNSLIKDMSTITNVKKNASKVVKPFQKIV
ncbi:29415_t:CDS:2, partial [Gigaspora margarita]